MRLFGSIYRAFGYGREQKLLCSYRLIILELYSIRTTHSYRDISSKSIFSSFMIVGNLNSPIPEKDFLLGKWLLLAYMCY